MTDKAIVEAHVARLEKIATVRFKPMFGEWGAYLNESFAAIIGDGRLFIKVKGLSDSQIDTLFGNRNQPYEGAKNYAEADPEDFNEDAWVVALREALIAAKVFPESL